MHVLIFLVPIVLAENNFKRFIEDGYGIEVFDLTHPTRWKDMATFYGAIEKGWKICVNCGIPGLGTGLHMGHVAATSSMLPSIIPMEYLLTRLEIIDISYLTKVDPGLVLSLDVALQWPVLKHDARQPTLILFNFGWALSDKFVKGCICRIPGLSYELAEYIASNLTHVVGVATDAPTLESEETREMTKRTVANALGKNGIYIIENVNLKRKLPERGCMALALPLKLLQASYVPTRLVVFCPSHKTERYVSIALRKTSHPIPIVKNDIDLNEILETL
ncbi:unnamed protein product [Colias eurytheme]|nr:unnamed protein product [Colias eurytheme]